MPLSFQERVRKQQLQQKLAQVKEKEDFMSPETYQQIVLELENEIIELSQDEINGPGIENYSKEQQREIYRNNAIAANKQNPWRMIVEYHIIDKEPGWKFTLKKDGRMKECVIKGYRSFNETQRRFLNRQMWTINGQDILFRLPSNAWYRFERVLDVCRKNKAIGRSVFPGSYEYLKSVFGPF